MPTSMPQNDNALGRVVDVAKMAGLVSYSVPKVEVESTKMTSSPRTRLQKLLDILPKLDTQPIDLRKSLNEFHYFPRLPFELRLKVIRKTDMMVTPSQIKIDPENLLPSNCFMSLEFNQKRALEVNSEFRQVGLAIFNPIKVYTRPHAESAVGSARIRVTQLYVKTEIDTVIVLDGFLKVDPQDSMLWLDSRADLRNFEFLWSQPDTCSVTAARAKVGALGWDKISIRVLVNQPRSRTDYAVDYMKRWYNYEGLRSHVIDEMGPKKVWVNMWNEKRTRWGGSDFIKVEDLSWTVLY